MTKLLRKTVGRRSISMLLAVAMIFGMLPMSVFATGRRADVGAGTYAVPYHVQNSATDTGTPTTRVGDQFITPASLTVDDSGEMYLDVEVTRNTSSSNSDQYYIKGRFQYQVSGSDAWIDAEVLETTEFTVSSWGQSKSDTRYTKVRLNGLSEADLAGIAISFDEYKIKYNSSNSLNGARVGYLALDLSNVKKEQAEAPSISLSSSDIVFTGSTKVAITSPTEGASLYYTVNGGVETLYTGAFTLSETAEIVAYTSASGYDDSDTTSYLAIHADDSAPVSMMKADDTGSSSMASGTLYDTAYLVFEDDGSVSLLAKFQKATIMMVPASPASVDYYTTDTYVESAEAIRAEYLTTNSGNPEWVKIPVSHPEIEGVYVQFYVSEISSTQNAFISIDTSGVDAWPSEEEQPPVEEEQPPVGGGDSASLDLVDGVYTVPVSHQLEASHIQSHFDYWNEPFAKAEVVDGVATYTIYSKGLLEEDDYFNFAMYGYEFVTGEVVTKNYDEGGDYPSSFVFDSGRSELTGTFYCGMGVDGQLNEMNTPLVLTFDWDNATEYVEDFGVPNGIYEVPAYMASYSSIKDYDMSSSASMSNKGLVSVIAEIVNGETILTVQFKAVEVGTLNGHITAFGYHPQSVVDTGSIPSSSANGMNNVTLANYLSYKDDISLSIQDAEGVWQPDAKDHIEYFEFTYDANAPENVFLGLWVDAMTNFEYQTAVLVLDWDNATTSSTDYRYISVNSSAHKTDYQIGDSIDLTGLTIETVAFDGAKKTVNVTSSMITGFDTSAEGFSRVWIEYGGRTTSYTIDVTEKMEDGIADGIYEVPIYMAKYSYTIKEYTTDDEGSMSNGAVAGNAIVEVKDGKSTVTAQFKGMTILSLEGHLLDVGYHPKSVVDTGTIPTSSAIGMGNVTATDILSYKHDLGLSVQDEEENWIPQIQDYLEYFTFTYDVKAPTNIYMGVWVDAMGTLGDQFAYQTAVMVFDWDKAVEVTRDTHYITVNSTTHSTDYDEVSLDLTNLTIEVVNLDGTSKTVPVTKDMITTELAYNEVMYRVWIEYDGRTTSYTVNIVAGEEGEGPEEPQEPEVPQEPEIPEEPQGPVDPEVPENGIPTPGLGSDLADGTYSIQIEMLNISDNGEYSMSHDAVDHTAKIFVKNGVAYLSINFTPLYLSSVIGHLQEFWFYNANNPASAKNLVESDRVKASYSNYYDHTGTGDPIYTTDGKYPGTVTFRMPYFGAEDGADKLYSRVDVDAMGEFGEQDVIMKLDHATLTPLDVEATLSVDTSKVTFKVWETQTATANVVGGAGYTITWTSSDNSIATVSNGTITGVAMGNATITITATKGDDTLTKTILVTVVAVDAEHVTVETPVVSGDIASTEITGDTFLTTDGCPNVDDGVTEIVLSATSGNATVTSAEVTISGETVVALAGTDKDVIIVTDTGTVKLNASAMESMKGESSLTLIVSATDAKDSNITSVGDFSKAFEFKILDGEDSSVVFKGIATVTVPCDDDVKWAYHIVDGKIADRVSVSVSGGFGTFSTTHFSTWALSANEYEVESENSGDSDNSGSLGGGSTSTGYFLEDGNYYVNVHFWNATSSVASMGDVALSNNRKALVTVVNGKVTRVEIATNPVSIGSEDGTTVNSAIQNIKLGSYTGKDVNVLQETSYTTSENSINFNYIQRAWFNYSDTNAAQPERSSEITYATVAMYVPDTPMDLVSSSTDFYMSARLRFVWSSATATNATSLNQSSGTVSGSVSGGSSGGDYGDPDVETSDTTSGDTISDTTIKDLIAGGMELRVVGKDGLLAQFSVEALEAILELASYRGVTFRVESAQDLNEIQQEVVGDRPVYSLTVTSNGNAITDFEGGRVTVTLPYVLAEGENAEGLVIWYIDDEGNVEAIPCIYDEDNEIVKFNTTHFSHYAIGYDESLIWVNPFTDVEEGDWYYNAVRYVQQNGLFAGTTESTFSPTTKMTRAMIWMVLARLAEVDPSSDGVWYAVAQQWAMDHGISDGTDHEGSVSRQQLVTMLYSLHGAEAVDTDLSMFSDLDEIADWALEPVKWAVANGMIEGRTTTTLAPQSNANRAEVATILIRYIELKEKEAK
ncbi:MAG: NEAT domain-containing protein [Eubacteriales bacterium]